MYLISIIVPIYNVKNYLRHCIDSILAQTYKKVEIILVDDGSTDGSGEIADSYKRKYPEIIVLHKKNGGLADARNYGIEYATGDYIYFVDSDDWIEPDSLSNLMNPIFHEHVDLVMSGYFIDYANENYSIECNIQDELVFNCVESIPEAIYNMEQSNFNVVWNKLYSAELIKKNNLRFEIDAMPGEDLLFNCKYMMLEPSVALISEKTYHYMRCDEDTLAGKYRENLVSQVERFNRARRDMYEYFSMDSEIYQELYARTFVDYVFTCIPNLYKKKCKLSRRDKMKELRTILNTSKLKCHLNHIKKKTIYQKLLAILIEVKDTFLPLVILDILFWIRYHLQNVYQSIRKKVVNKQIN